MEGRGRSKAGDCSFEDKQDEEILIIIIGRCEDVRKKRSDSKRKTLRERMEGKIGKSYT